MAETRQRFRFLILLQCLILLIITLPLIDDYAVTTDLVSIAYSTLLFITVYVLAENKKLFLLGLFLGLPNILISWNILTFDSITLAINLKLTSGILVDFFVIVFLLDHIFKSNKVSFNLIYAAICVYLLLGVCWSVAYTLIEFNFPGSFAGIGSLTTSNNSLAPSLDNKLTLYTSNFLYFSYITLTTLGYGNVYPLTLAGNALASLEALTGQLFLTILIGRLIGLHIAQSKI